MGWAVGRDSNRKRHIGYGVPAICDHPGCGAEIDRGMYYACGGGQTATDACCGLFFCSEHLAYGGIPEGVSEAVCDRCAAGEEPFEPTPDTLEWCYHVLHDESWAQFRAEETIWTLYYLQRVAESSPPNGSSV